jgi:protein ImuA
MKPLARERLIGDLRAHVRALDGSALREHTVLPFGVAAIDAHLPGGGLVRGALHEVMGGQNNPSHEAAATLFTAAIAARLDGPVLWVMKRRDLFAPGLAQVGLHPDRVLYAEAGDMTTLLLVMEEGLKHAGLAAVVGEIDRLPLTAARRLQLAAEKSGVTAFALRRWRGGAEDAGAAVTRWQVEALPSSPLATPGIGRARWRLDLLRCRNADRGSWIVEAADAQGHLARPAELLDRPAAARGRRSVRAA